MRNRSVIEIMVLTFTFVVAFAILATGALVAIIEIKDPAADTSALTRTLTTTTTLIAGSLLGLLAGKNVELGHRPDDPPPAARRDPGNVVPTWNAGREQE